MNQCVLDYTYLDDADGLVIEHAIGVFLLSALLHHLKFHYNLRPRGAQLPGVSSIHSRRLRK